MEATLLLIKAVESGLAHFLVILPNEEDKAPFVLRGFWRFKDYPNAVRMSPSSFSILDRLGIRVVEMNRDIAEAFGKEAKKKGGLSKVLMKPIKIKVSAGKEERPVEEDLPF